MLPFFSKPRTTLKAGVLGADTCSSFMPWICSAMFEGSPPINHSPKQTYPPSRKKIAAESEPAKSLNSKNTMRVLCPSIVS